MACVGSSAEMPVTLSSFTTTTVCLSFLDNDAENDLQSDIGRALQDTAGKGERVQLLPHCSSPGFAEPDPGPLGLSAAKKDPSPEVLSGSKCRVQLL